MSPEQNFANADKITTYNFLGETYYATWLLIFFINEITKTSAKTHAKNQKKKKIEDGKVENACSIAQPSEME